jgi:hypothetical protein
MHGLGRSLREVSRSDRLAVVLVLEIVLGGHDMLLIGAIFFLVIVVVTANSNNDPLWLPFLPLFTGFGSSFSTFASGFL